MSVDRRRLASAVVVGVVGLAGVAACWLGYRYHGPAGPVEIYRGITYGCDAVPDVDGGGGLVHWVRADLAVPGVRLYVTPLDAGARAAGWEYKLRHVSTAVADDGLAAAVNGTLFSSDSTLVRLPGDLARSAETVVADGVVNHVDPNTYLLWWDRSGVAHMDQAKPPGPAVLAGSAWAIGGQQGLVIDGAVLGWVDGTAFDHRTAIGADPRRRLAWIACFDRASYASAGREMVRLGATIAILVDGGTSTAMAIGGDARGARPGTVTGNWRPVATQFGFRADPLPR